MNNTAIDLVELDNIFDNLPSTSSNPQGLPVVKAASAGPVKPAVVANAVPSSASVPASTPTPLPLHAAVKLIDEPEKLFDFSKTKLTPLQQLYIIAFVTKGTKTMACRIANVPMTTVNIWMKDKEFVEALQNATDAIGDMLEQEAIRRAMDGSDRLLWKLLQGHKPDKYADKRINTTNIQGEIVHSWADLATRASQIIQAENYSVGECEQNENGNDT